MSSPSRHPGELTSMPTPSTFIIHVNTLIVNNLQEILLVTERKPQNRYKLNLPGGHLELGEELVKGAQREAREMVRSTRWDRCMRASRAMSSPCQHHHNPILSSIH